MSFMGIKLKVESILEQSLFSILRRPVSSCLISSDSYNDLGVIPLEISKF